MGIKQSGSPSDQSIRGAIVQLTIQNISKLKESMQQQLDNAYKRQTSLAADEKRLIQCQNQIKHTKAGSIAMVGKITTLSKLRISNPVHPGDPLDGIRLSIDSMNKICEKV